MANPGAADSSDQLAKTLFTLVMAGAVAFVAAVLVFVLL